jgi:stalled ribosome rescue protein Dom34
MSRKINALEATTGDASTGAVEGMRGAIHVIPEERVLGESLRARGALG